MPGIGETLRDARIRARIDMAEVESQTKIRARYLRAMENEEWDVLPGPVYTRSFLRTYADYLGLDSRMLVEEFKARYEPPAEHELRPIGPTRRDRDEGHIGRGGIRAPPWLAILVVLVGVGVALYIIGNNKNGPAGNTTRTHASVHKARHHPVHHHHAVPKPPKPKTVTVKLTPTAAVYVCLVNGAGKHLIPGITYSPGQTIPIETARELFLTLGNADVQMKVNGKPVTIAPSAAPLAYRIRVKGTSLVPNGSQPSCP